MNQAEIVTQYAEAWNQTTESAIMAVLERCWTPLSTYTDPTTDTRRGPVELAQAILGYQKLFPGAVLSLTSALDAHHGVGRFSWRLTLPAPVEVNGRRYPAEMDGVDFVEFTADQTRILRIVGFFGPFPR